MASTTETVETVKELTGAYKYGSLPRSRPITPRSA
jgi:hypothetical protein